MQESPLYIRTYDLLLWLIPQTQKFPRAYRFTVSEHIQELLIGFQNGLISAGKKKGNERRKYLQDADIQLEQLRFWIRFARDKELQTFRQYEHVIKMVNEIGRLLGAWLKKIA